MAKTLLISLLLLLSFPFCHAGNTNSLDTSKVYIRVKAGYSIGGTAPLGMPATIRSIDAYRLTPSVMAGTDVSIPVGHKWGLEAGLSIQNKAMNAEITTEGYNMEMKKGDNNISGLFTGHIKQEVTEWMVSIPIHATYCLNDKITVKAGPYFSLLVYKNFSGIAFDGYIRQGGPTGARIDIGNVEGQWATYDFSDNMRSLQYGISAGVDWQAFDDIGFSANIDWGLSGIFKNDFKTIEQTLYPIYANLGLFYKF